MLSFNALLCLLSNDTGNVTSFVDRTRPLSMRTCTWNTSSWSLPIGKRVFNNPRSGTSTSCLHPAHACSSGAKFGSEKI